MQAAAAAHSDARTRVFQYLPIGMVYHYLLLYDNHRIPSRMWPVTGSRIHIGGPIHKNIYCV